MDDFLNGRKSVTERKPAANSTYTQGGVSCSADGFVGIESSLLRINLSGKNPTLRVAAKRYKQA